MAYREELARQLEDADEEVRHLAVQALTAFGAEALELIGGALGDSSWRVRKAALEAFVAIPGTGKIQILLRGIRDEESAGRRNTSMEALIRVGTEALPYLSDLLEDDDPDVRKFGVDILGNIESPDVPEMLLAALRDEADNVAAAAAEYLGAKKYAGAVPGLMARIESGDFWVKFSCIKALGDIGVPTAGAAVMKAASRKDLRKVSLETLGKLRVPEAGPLVVEGLFSTDRGLRRIAVLTGARLLRDLAGNPETAALRKGVAERADEPFRGYLEELLRHDDAALRESAMIVLAAAAGKAAIVPLLGVLADAEEDEQAVVADVLAGLTAEDLPALYPLLRDSQPAVRRCAANVIGRRNCVDALPMLIRLRDDENGHVRSEAAKALGRLGNQIAAEPLVSLLKDPYPDVRQAATEALNVMGGRAESLRKLVLDFLSPQLDAQDPDQVASALRVAASLGSPEIVQRLRFALKDERVQVRRAAVEAAVMVESDEVLEILPLALTDEDATVRREAVQRIGAVGRKEGLPLLAPMLQDEDLWVRVRAIQAIAGYEGNEARRVILATVRSSPPGPVKLAAIRSLGTAGSPEELALLLDIAAAGDRESRMAAIEALGQTEGDEAVSCLVACLQDEDWGLRSAAVKALGAFVEEQEAREALEGAARADADPMVRKTADAVLGRTAT